MLSPAMARALRAIGDGDTRIDFVQHRRAWVTIHGRRVADTTVRALERRGYVAPVAGRSKRPSYRLTHRAKGWLRDQREGLGEG